MTNRETEGHEPAGAGPSHDDAAEEPRGAALRAAVMLGLLVLLTVWAGWWGLVMFAGIVVMVMLHEFGHFLVAKRSGMKVTEFFVGFGPRIWSVRRGETEYGVKAILAGGYVRIIGMNNLEEVDPADEPRTYRAQPFWQRFGVAVAGSTMHALQALVLIFVLLVGWGLPRGGSLMGSSPDNVVWSVDEVVAGCPASQGGIRPGDQIVAIDGKPTPAWPDAADLIRLHPDTRMVFTVRRGAGTVDLPVGVLHRTVDGEKVGLVGLSMKWKDPPRQRMSAGSAVPRTFSEFGGLVSASVGGMMRTFSLSGLRGIAHDVSTAQADRAANERAAASSVPPTTAVPSTPGSDASSRCEKALNALGSAGGPGIDPNRVSSILGIFNIGRSMASGGGVVYLVGLFAAINIFLGLLNLLPFPPLDGGHVVLAVYEKAQEWRHGMRTRYLADYTRVLPVLYVALLFIGLIGISSLYLDIVNPVSVK